MAQPSPPTRINGAPYLPMGGYKGPGLRSSARRRDRSTARRSAAISGFRRTRRPAAIPNVAPVKRSTSRFIPPGVQGGGRPPHQRSGLVAAAADEIRVPGQGRVARRRERERDGVPLSTALIAQVDDVASSLGIVPLSARS
jgi:hypothetical protein